MDNDRNFQGGHPDSVYSKRVRAGKRRTYFFDVRRTKGDDFYLTLTESTKRLNDDGYERHKIFLYKEDFNRFVEGLEEAVNYIKTELMPNYDYDEFTRRHEEYEAEDFNRDNRRDNPPPPPRERDFEARRTAPLPPARKSTDEDDDMSW